MEVRAHEASPQSRVPRLTLTFGLLIAAMGYAVYFATGRTTFGAMTPTFLGVPVVLAAVVANTPRLRRAALVLACTCALVGTGIAAYKLHSIGAFDATRRPIEVGRSIDDPTLPQKLRALDPQARSIALQRAHRQWKAGLVAWPAFAAFCLGYVALATSAWRRERNSASGRAT